MIRRRILLMVVAVTGCTRAGDGAPRSFPAVGVAVMDSAMTWCAVFPAGARALGVGQRVTIVLAAPAEAPAWGARVTQRRAAPCHTEFAQPGWADYVAYDLAPIDSARPAAEGMPLAALAVASDAVWRREPDGRVRADLDGDGVPEEARVCQEDEGQHFTIWSVAPASEPTRRRRRAHEYFDWGALVDPTCAPDEIAESSDSAAT